MEVLLPAQFPTQLPPALFSERRNTTSSLPTPSRNPNTPLHPSAPASPSGTTDQSLGFTKTPSPTDFVNENFLPLPTIVASPICSPSSGYRPSSAQSFNSQPEAASILGHDLTPTRANDRLKGKTPSGSQLSLRVLSAAPTWISTPPTPPHKQIGNLSSYDSWRPPSPVSPSASFPTSIPLHDVLDGLTTTRLKRCLSVPSMSPRSRAISIPTLASESLSKSRLSEAFNEQPVQKFKRPTRATFHLPKDTDDCSSMEYAPSSIVEPSQTKLNQELESPTDGQTREMKDANRTLHALQELLSTEIDYVKDLRILLVAYIQHLATFEVRASAFARASASFSTGPWVSAYAGQILSPVDGMLPSTSSTSMRPIFSESEINLITRNLKEILWIHEDFISSLRRIVTSFGLSDSFGISNLSRPESGFFASLMSTIETISKKFITEAPKFEAYQTLCAGHPEAISLIQRAVSQHPSEWENFEQRCQESVSKLDALGENNYVFDLSRNKDTVLLEVPHGGKIRSKRRRTMSAVSPGAKLSTSCIKEVDCVANSKQPRLVLADYLIKPVQRICKYPLLLQQLVPGSSSKSGEVPTLLGDAIQVMRGVASSVDEARRKREAITKSSLIISRLVLPPMSPSLSSGSPVSASVLTHSLTPGFLSSLGPCLLSGSLDVMYYTPRQSLGQIQTITAKYLGTFLYSGGYLILAKIHKGKKYEPKHWFSLADFEATGDESDEAMLPYSFRLSSKTILFELAAACQKEKDIWLQAISSSREQEPSWCNMPLPSFKGVGKGHRLSDMLADEFSLNILAFRNPGAPEIEGSTSFFRTEPRRKRLTLKKSEVVTLQDHSQPSNRRSSTASIKSIFAPVGYDPNSIYINRSLISVRLQIDHELQDVASQVCLSARLQARLRDEALFPQPLQQYRERAGFSRSASAINVAGLARNRLSKQESLRIPRRKPHCDSMMAFEGQLPPDVPPLPLSARRSGKRLSLQTLPPRSFAMIPVDRVLPLSASFSNTPSGRGTPLTAPASFSVSGNPLSRPSSPLSLERRGSRGGFVRSMKGFFSRSGQTSPQSPSNLRSFYDKMPNHSSPPPFRRRFTLRKAAFRRRSRSIAPDEELPVTR